MTRLDGRQGRQVAPPAFAPYAVLRETHSAVLRPGRPARTTGTLDRGLAERSL